jgi:uncharacterized protein with PQ loop repeat
MPKTKISTPSSSETKDLFFLWSSIGILCFVIAAFVLKVIVQPERLARYTPLVIVHATLMILWLILFAVQAGLIQQGSFSIHRKLGRLQSSSCHFLYSKRIDGRF